MQRTDRPVDHGKRRQRVSLAAVVCCRHGSRKRHCIRSRLLCRYALCTPGARQQAIGTASQWHRFTKARAIDGDSQGSTECHARCPRYLASRRRLQHNRSHINTLPCSPCALQATQVSGSPSCCTPGALTRAPGVTRPQGLCTGQATGRDTKGEGNETGAGCTMLVRFVLICANLGQHRTSLLA